MSSGMSLIMEKPVEELIPKMLSWNNAELMERVEATLKAYEGVTYGDGQIVTAKQDRAQLNAFCKALNDERIRIGKVYSAPYERFKSEVDEVLSKVKGVVSEIDGQVKAYEERKQREKQEEIRAYFDEVIGEYAGCIPYERVHDPRWLNATVGMKAVKGEIDGVLESVRNAMVAIEALRSADEGVIKALYFRTLNLSEALMEGARLKEERERADKVGQVTERAEETMVVSFRVEGTVEQLKALQRYLRENRIKYEAI